MTIGFIGLGAMGTPMFGHLLAAGLDLAIHTRRPEAAAPYLERGVRRAGTPAELAALCEMVFVCLPTPANVEDVVRGPEGLAEGFRPGAGLVDFSTNSPVLVRALSEALARVGVAMLDAPVSGGPKGAAARRLAIWASGDRALYDRVKPALDLMGDEVSYLGAIGNGTVAKLIHNCANYGVMMVLAEVFTLGVKAGMDPLDLFTAVRQGTLGRRSVVDRLADQFLPGEFDKPSFALELAHKDVMLATELGRQTGVPMKIANMTLAEMTEALNRGWGRRDSRSTMLLQEERAGVRIEVPREEIARAIPPGDQLR